MERAITGYHRDEEADWVAELSCGHNQHVRHRPPFQLRAWVLEPEGRTERLGTPLDCPLCDRAELPGDLRLVRSGPEWDEHTVPTGLLRAHQLAGGTWGRIVVHDGQLQFVAATEPVVELVLRPGSTQAIPPEIEHMVQLLGPVRFSIEFLAVDRRARSGMAPQPGADGRAPQQELDEGGDPACWAGSLCPECGVVLDGGPHRQSCQATSPA